MKGVSTSVDQCELCIYFTLINKNGLESRAEVTGDGDDYERSLTHILRLPPGSVVTFTKLTSNIRTGRIAAESESHRRLYNILFFALPFGVFFFS